LDTTRPSKGCLGGAEGGEGGGGGGGGGAWWWWSIRSKFQRGRPHVRPVCVENSNDAHTRAVLAVEFEAKRFPRTLALVVTRPDAGAADVTPVRLWLRVHVRVAVHL
jgi:hypothetical protein